MTHLKRHKRHRSTRRSISLDPMDYTTTALRLLLFSCLFYSTSTAHSSNSVLFIDSRSHNYLRPQNHPVTDRLISVTEIGAVVTVLLGLAPSASLSPAGSAKLNEILVPNPFNRPRAVFMLQVTATNELAGLIDSARFGKVVGSKVDSGSDKADIELPGEEVAVVSLDEGLASYTDEEINDFATSMGGSYVVDASVALNGELTVPLFSGASMNLHMSKKADREFVLGLVDLFCNSRKGIEMHEDLSQQSQRPAELLMGCFHGVKALQEQYGHDDIVQQGWELFLSALSKTMDSLQASYRGEIVGVVLFYSMPHSESETMLNVMLTSRPYARWLADVSVSSNGTNTTIAEVQLVRKTLAWITGIILLISTFIGIYLLVNMPLTRDTLLYSNVKLD